MRTSQAPDVTKKVLAAYFKAWTDIKNPAIDGENDHFHNTYATLKSTLAAVRVACAKNGLSYMQAVETEDGASVLTSYIIDGDGDAVELSNYHISTTGTPQQFGSALTYTKRQQAQADWGITGEPDDDAEGASWNTAQKAVKPASTAIVNKLGDRVAEFAEKAGKSVSDAYAAICASKAVKATGYDGSADMTEQQAKAALGITEAWLRKLEDTKAEVMSAVESAEVVQGA